jgi:hypothetical protein
MLALVLLAPLGAGLAACSASDSADLSENHSLDHKAGSPMDRSIPVGLKIPAVKVNASPMLKLGVDEEGNLQVPSIDQAERPGWYSHSVTPGENGVSVLVARFSTPRGPGLLPKGSLLKVGDKIHIKRSDGGTATFIITVVEQRNVKSIAATSLDLKSKRPELLLITPGCELTKKITHHETHKGDKSAGNETKGIDYCNVVFSARLTQGAPKNDLRKVMPK